MSTDNKTPLVTTSCIVRLRIGEPDRAPYAVRDIYEADRSKLLAEIDRLKALLGREWIPVGERLPELTPINLASTSPYRTASHSRDVFVYRDIEGWDEDERIQKAHLRQTDDKEPYWSCGSSVTHWMPIPEAPITSPTPEEK